MHRKILSALLGALVASSALLADQPVAAQPPSAAPVAALPSPSLGMIPASGNKNLPDLRACLLADPTGIEDRCFNASAWRGILSFYGDTWEWPRRKGKSYDLLLSRSFSDMAPALDMASGRGYDLLVAAGFLWADAMADIAPRHPGQSYLILDVDWVGGRNVMQITFAEHEGTYLAGAAAALKARSEGLVNPKFGFVGGMPGPVVTAFEMGYIQGVRSVYPEAEILEYYANDWASPGPAKDVAKRWYAGGVYAIFSAAGGTGYGVIAQARESRMAGMDVWAIGVDADQYEDGLYAEGKSAVLTSMVKRLDNGVRFALARVADGSFRGETICLGARGEGVDFATTNPELGADIVAEVDAIKARIASGELRVYRSYAETMAAGLAPAGLGASDR